MPPLPSERAPALLQRTGGTLFLGCVFCACAPSTPSPSLPDVEPPTAGPACFERAAPLAWPRSRSPAFARGQEMFQVFEGEGERALAFAGAHAYDLLEQLSRLSGEASKRALVCEVLNRVADAGAPVVRLWGSLRRTGEPAELGRARAALALLLDENARRARPLRFIVTLLNHQAGYGLPDPSHTLDDQAPWSPWSSSRTYLQGGWRERGVGQLAERVEVFAAEPLIARSPYVLAWELVNELDTFRVGGEGHFRGPAADGLRQGFLVPALEHVANRLPHLVMAGELRGWAGQGYSSFTRALVGSLETSTRARLLWTAHVYQERGLGWRAYPTKLDHDLSLAAALSLPFVLGEIGEYVRGATLEPCGRGPRHELPPVFEDVLEPGGLRPLRGRIHAVLLWGEGLCDVRAAHPATPSRLSIGVGGDSADVSPFDDGSRSAIGALRESPRFRPR